MDLDDFETVDELPAGPHREIPAADRELLELVARALGAVRVEDIAGEEYLILHFEDGSVANGWNPLVHSDDALALSIARHIGIRHDLQFVEAFVLQDQVSYILVTEYCVTENLRKSATCRAIVRAAAEIIKTTE